MRKFIIILLALLPMLINAETIEITCKIENGNKITFNRQYLGSAESLPGCAQTRR